MFVAYMYFPKEVRTSLRPLMGLTCLVFSCVKYLLPARFTSIFAYTIKWFFLYRKNICIISANVDIGLPSSDELEPNGTRDFCEKTPCVRNGRTTTQ